MAVEQMITEAILHDKFSHVLHKIAGEQDAYARKTSGFNLAGNAMIGAGAALLAFGAKSIQAAGKVDEFRRTVAKVRGDQEAAFATDFVDKFDKHSSFAYFDLIDAAKRLEIQHGNLGKSFADVADTAATSGRSLMDVVRVYDAIKGGGRVGLGLSARGGLAQFGIQPKDLFEAEGIKYTPGMKLQNAMTPDQLLDAWHKVLIKTGKSGYDKVAATTTLRGSQSMIEGAMERLEKNLGAGSLPQTVTLLNNLAGAINDVSESVKNTPGFGDKMILGGGGLLAAGGIVKGYAAWRQYTSILKMAKIAGDAERAGEAAKPAIAAREAAAIKGSAFAVDGLRGKLSQLGVAATYGTKAEGLFTSTLGAGIVTAGAYAVAIAGLAYDIGLVVNMFNEANKASRDFEASSAAVLKAKGEGYDLKAKAGQATGYDALPVWKQVGYTALNTWSFGLASKLTGGRYEEENAGTTALTDAHSRALAKKHGMAPHGIRAQQIAEQKAAAAASAEARRQAAADRAAAAGDAANKYQLDPRMDYRLKSDERRIELLKEMGGHQKELKAARSQEISDLGKAAGLLEKQAALATDIRAKYDLMNQAADDRQKAKMLGLEGAKDKRDKMDKTIANILGGGGLSEGDLLKKAGIGRAYFSSFKKGQVPQNPLKTSLEALSKRPIIVNLQLSDKPFAQMRAEFKDDTISDLIKVLEGSQARAMYGGFH